MSYKPPRLLTIRFPKTEAAPDVPDLECSFLEWKDMERDKAYLVGPSGEALVLTISRPSTAGLLWTAPTIPPRIPTLILPIRLMPPPTRMNAKEATALRDFSKTANAALATGWFDAVAEFLSGAWSQGIGSVQHPEPWEVRYGECLAPPDDLAEFSEVSDRINRLAQAEYEQRRAEEATWTKEEASDWLFGSDSSRQATEEEYQAFLANRQEDLRKDYAWYPLTMPRLLKDWGGEVTKFLHVRWARESGVDLHRMSKEKELFLTRIQRVAVLADGTDPSISRKQLPWYAASLEDLAASVRFRVTMSDGEIAWISGITVRDPIDTVEREEHTRALAAHSECQFMTMDEVLAWLDQEVPRNEPRGGKAWKNYCKMLKHPPKEPFPRARLIEIRKTAEVQLARPAVAKRNAKRSDKDKGQSLEEDASSYHRVSEDSRSEYS